MIDSIKNPLCPICKEYHSATEPCKPKHGEEKKSYYENYFYADAFDR